MGHSRSYRQLGRVRPTLSKLFDVTGTSIKIFPRPDQRKVEIVDLPDGRAFPRKMHFVAHSDGGAHIDLVVEATDSGPGVASFTVTNRGREPLNGLNVSLAFEMPFSQLLDEFLDHAAAWASMVRDTEDRSQAELAATQISGPKARRGRPVGVETLQMVADIVLTNLNDPRDAIVEELDVSYRTASRYILQAKQYGFLGDKED